MEQTKQKNTEEIVSLEVLGNYDNNGKIDYNMLNKNLRNIEGLTEGLPIKSLPTTLVVNEYNVIIDEDGSVSVYTKPVELTLEQAKDENMLEKTDNSIVNVVDGKITIPIGFKVSQDSGTTINSGIVIEDSESNQFVWVPVSKENFEKEFVRHDFANQNIPDEHFISTEITDYRYYEPNPESVIGVKEEVKSMYKSVKINGGFYIARYEAGNENGKLVSKKMYQPWQVQFTNSEGEDYAIQLAREMFPGHSHLCYGVEWDAIMRWIDTDINLKKYLLNSTEIGHYVSSEDKILTGSNEKYSIKNIYDMAGNTSEWTMEKRTKNIIIRGGSSKNTGKDRTIANRTTANPAWTAAIRIAFYV